MQAGHDAPVSLDRGDLAADLGPERSGRGLAVDDAGFAGHESDLVLADDAALMRDPARMNKPECVAIPAAASSAGEEGPARLAAVPSGRYLRTGA
ncbi:hypothetical protein OCUBac02_13240 [Bosea sp. ANAM02]|nr:hypothetical protein OCUBac02_13240 [Bosea sp. ANAM02]